MAHFGQLIKKKEFVQFDYYYESINFKHYYQAEPPKIDLSKIPAEIPIALLRGKKDELSDKIDVALLNTELPNVIMYKEYEEFDHDCLLFAQTCLGPLTPSIYWNITDGVSSQTLTFWNSLENEDNHQRP